MFPKFPDKILAAILEHVPAKDTNTVYNTNAAPLKHLIETYAVSVRVCTSPKRFWTFENDCISIEISKDQIPLVSWLIPLIQKISVDKKVPCLVSVVDLVTKCDLEELVADVPRDVKVNVKSVKTSRVFKTVNEVSRLIVDSPISDKLLLCLDMSLSSLEVWCTDSYRHVAMLMKNNRDTLKNVTLVISLRDGLDCAVAECLKLDMLTSLSITIEETSDCEDAELLLLYNVVKKLKLAKKLAKLSIHYKANNAGNENNSNSVRLMMVSNLMGQVDWHQCLVSVKLSLNRIEVSDEAKLDLIRELPIDLDVQAKRTKSESPESLNAIYNKYLYLKGVVAE